MRVVLYWQDMPVELRFIGYAGFLPLIHSPRESAGMASTTSPRWAALPLGLGVLLRNARVDGGFSRDTLASAIGTSAHTVQAIEEERRPPAVDVAERLCEVLALGAWEAAVLTSVAVDTGALRTRRGIRHANRRGTALPDAVRERITTERAAGRSWAAIACGLNRDGVATAERGQWWASSVSRAVVSGAA